MTSTISGEIITTSITGNEGISTRVVGSNAVSTIISTAGSQGIPGVAGTTTWSGLSDIPTSFPPETHGNTVHNEAYATETALGGKVDKVDGKGLSTNDYTDIDKNIVENLNLLIYAEKTNVLELNNTTEFTPDTDYEPATKKYVDDNVGVPAGNDAAIQFNDNGAFGGVDAFKYDRVSGAITIGESVEILPNVPLAIEKDIDDYVQVTFQNKSDDPSASMDIVITADNGTDETHYLDIGVNSSMYDDPAYPIFKANDGYLYSADDDLDIGTGGDGKIVRLFAGGYALANIAMEVDASGINLPSGKTFRINGTPIGSSPDFLSLTDVPHTYSGQAGKAVSVKPAEDGLEFVSISGLGDMKVSVYDPTGIARNAFDTDNHVAGSTNGVYTLIEKSKLGGIATGAEVNVQSDWNEADTGSDAYIKNKPTIPGSLTPGDTVVSETSYGQAANPGIATAYSRADHTHGTPTQGTGGVTEEMAIAYSVAMGGI